MIKNTYDGSYFLTGEEMAEALETLGEMRVAEEYNEARTLESELGADPVERPAHYRQHPSGVECIEITEHFNFNVGNAIKYLWRAGLKSPDAIQDLRKGAWYVQREIERLAE